jgi:hypothetical protein
VLDDVGVDPSVVYLIAALGVAQDMVTFWVEEYDPPSGVNVGVAHCVKIV